MIGKWMASRGVRPGDRDQDVQPDGRGSRTTGSRAPGSGGRSSRASTVSASTRVDLYLAHEFDPDVPLAETRRNIRGTGRAQADQGLGRQQLRRASSSRRCWRAGRPPSCRTRTRCSTAATKRGRGAAVRRVRDRVHAVRPARRRLADREVQARRAGARGLADGDAARPVRASARRGDVRCARPASRRSRTRRGVDPATLAIAWLLAQPQVTAVVVGPRRPEHLEPALTALEHRLSQSDADELGALFE